jgi:rhamnosyltransferase subunit B
MSRIVINAWGSFGDVFPYVGLGKALQARGHRVRLALPGYYRDVVEREGLDFSSVGPDVDPNRRDLIARVMHPVRGPEAIVRDWLMPALRDSYRELEASARDADLLITHPVTFAAPVLAQKRGLPWVSTVLAPMSMFSASDVPVSPAAPWLAHFRVLGPWFGRLVVRAVNRATAAWVRPVGDLRAELGLPPAPNPIFAGQFSPLLTLALFSRVLAEPQPDWPAHVSVTGFVFYNGPDLLDAQLEAFLRAGEPPVVFTLGTSAVGAAGSFYEESAAAAARLGVRAVLLRGPFPDNDPKRTISKDVLVIDRAPHQLLFPRAAAVVHQGGAGTTGQALRSGRPALVVPHSHDQPDNAFRVAKLGVARTVFPRAYRAARVARDLDRLLSDASYHNKAEQVAAVVRGEGGADAAADLITGALLATPNGYAEGPRARTSG